MYIYAFYKYQWIFQRLCKVSMNYKTFWHNMSNISNIFLIFKWPTFFLIFRWPTFPPTSTFKPWEKLREKNQKTFRWGGELLEERMGSNSERKKSKDLRWGVNYQNKAGQEQTGYSMKICLIFEGVGIRYWRKKKLLRKTWPVGEGQTWSFYCRWSLNK